MHNGPVSTPPDSAPQLVVSSGRQEVAVLDEPRHRVSPTAPTYWRLWAWISLAITLVVCGTVLGLWWLFADAAPPWWAWAIAGLWVAADLVSLAVALDAWNRNPGFFGLTWPQKGTKAVTA